MNRNEIIELINANPTFCLASSENDIPHVRIITLVRADENGIIFSTGKRKDVYNQLVLNPQVEMHFWISDIGTQIRIIGAAKQIDDLQIKKLVVEKFTFLKHWVEKEGYEQLALFTLENAKAFVWTQEAEFKPKEYIKL